MPPGRHSLNKENAVFYIPHQPIYAILALAHVASSLGLSQVVVLGVLSACYAALALGR
jgi:hypothetical protein